MYFKYTKNIVNNVKLVNYFVNMYTPFIIFIISVSYLDKNMGILFIKGKYEKFLFWNKLDILMEKMIIECL